MAEKYIFPCVFMCMNTVCMSPYVYMFVYMYVRIYVYECIGEFVFEL